MVCQRFVNHHGPRKGMLGADGGDGATSGPWGMIHLDEMANGTRLCGHRTRSSGICAHHGPVSGDAVRLSRSSPGSASAVEPSRVDEPRGARPSRV